MFLEPNQRVQNKRLQGPRPACFIFPYVPGQRAYSKKAKRMNTPKDVHVIGLTGGIASGKSTVREALAKFEHVQVLDADKLGHAAYAPGTETIHKLVQAFGPEILNADGSVNRPKLGSIVFADRSRLQTLNEIVWPAIKQLALKELEKAREKAKVVVIEAAVLVEAMWTDIVDEIWTVRSSKTKERLMVRNNMSEKDAQMRLDSQSAMNKKREELAHVLLDNDGSMEDLIDKAEDALNDLEDRLCSRIPNGSELVDIVSIADNKVVDVRKRAIMRAFNLPHRATYVIVLHEPTQKYIVQKRSAAKEYLPSYFDPAPGGVVSAGESYELNAVREMEEELGIKNARFISYGDFWFESNRTKCWGRVFLCPVKTAFPEGFVLQESEVASIHLMSEDEILRERDRMTPDGIMAFEQYLSLKRSKI